MLLKIFTMVKDENDIVGDWITYHGDRFGYSNLHVVDNMSTDGTWELLERYRVTHGIHTYRERDYREKGRVMTRLFNRYAGPMDWVFPLDIDEFIFFYEDGDKKLSHDKHVLHAYLNNLRRSGGRDIYRMNYVQAVLDRPSGYDSIHDIRYGTYQDFGIMAKVFFQPRHFPHTLDHGNHCPKIHQWSRSSLVLVHYHFRNPEQHRKKVENNVTGLGHPMTLEHLKPLAAKGGVAGIHHIGMAVAMLENRFHIPYQNPEEINGTVITIPSFVVASQTVGNLDQTPR